MQKMLNQRTEYIRKLQEAAARREEQMAAQYAEREKSAVDAAEQKLCHEVEAKEHLSRQLAEATHLHAEAERRIATLQGTLFATGKASQPRASLRGNEVSSCTPSTTMCKSTATTMPTVAAAEAVEHRTPLPAVTTVPLLHTAAHLGRQLQRPLSSRRPQHTSRSRLWTLPHLWSLLERRSYGLSRNQREAYSVFLLNGYVASCKSTTRQLPSCQLYVRTRRVCMRPRELASEPLGSHRHRRQNYPYQQILPDIRLL